MDLARRKDKNMLKNFIVFTLVSMLVSLILAIVRSWASAASLDYRPIIAAFGIATMLIIGAVGWRRMNKITRWYLIAVLFVGALAILVSAK